MTEVQALQDVNGPSGCPSPRTCEDNFDPADAHGARNLSGALRVRRAISAQNRVK